MRFFQQFYGWVVIVLIIIFQGSTLGFMGFSFTFWVEPWSQAFGTPITQLMVISTLMMLIMGVFSAMAGRFLDRYPPNLIVSFGLVIFASALYGSSFAQSYWQVFALYGVVMPFATAFTGTLASQTLAVRWFRNHAHMGLAIGIAAMGVSVGGITIPPLVAEGLTTQDWRWVFRVTASILGFGLAPLMFFALMPLPKNDRQQDDGGPLNTSTPRAIPLKALFTNRYFIIPATAFFLDSVAYIGFQYNAASYMKSVGLDINDAAAVLSIMASVMLCAKLLVGKLTDHLHYRTVFVLAALSNCIALSIFSLALTDFILIGAIFLGLGAGGLIPLQAKIIATHFPGSQFAHVFGFFVFFPITAVVGSPLLSFMYEQTGSYSVPLMVMLAFVVAAILLMLTLTAPATPNNENETNMQTGAA